MGICISFEITAHLYIELIRCQVDAILIDGGEYFTALMPRMFMDIAVCLRGRPKWFDAVSVGGQDNRVMDQEMVRKSLDTSEYCLNILVSSQ